MSSSLARKMRRNQEKGKVNAPINPASIIQMPKSELTKLLKQDREKTSLVAVDMMACVFLATLKECYGFGNKRLNEVCTHVAGQIREIAEYRLNIEEVQKILEGTIDYKKIFNL